MKVTSPGIENRVTSDNEGGRHYAKDDSFSYESEVGY